MRLESRGSLVESTVQDGFWLVNFKVKLYYMYIEWLIALCIMWYAIRRRRKHV